MTARCRGGPMRPPRRERPAARSARAYAAAGVGPLAMASPAGPPGGEAGGGNRRGGAGGRLPVSLGVLEARSAPGVLPAGEHVPGGRDRYLETPVGETGAAARQRGGAGGEVDAGPADYVVRA